MGQFIPFETIVSGCLHTQADTGYPSVHLFFAALRPRNIFFLNEARDSGLIE